MRSRRVMFETAQRFRESRISVARFPWTIRLRSPRVPVSLHELFRGLLSSRRLRRIGELQGHRRDRRRSGRRDRSLHHRRRLGSDNPLPQIVRPILRVPAAAENWPVLLEHLRSIAMKAVDHGGGGAPHLCRGSHDLAPVCAIQHFGGDVDFARLDLIKRARELEKRVRLGALHFPAGRAWLDRRRPCRPAWVVLPEAGTDDNNPGHPGCLPRQACRASSGRVGTVRNRFSTP